MLRQYSKKRNLKEYLTIKSDIGEAISDYYGNSYKGIDYSANSIIDQLESLVHYEFEEIIKNTVRYDYSNNKYKIELLERLKKLRRWVALRHNTIWTKEAPSTKERAATRQAFVDSVKMTLLEMYNCILRTSMDAEHDQVDTRDLRSSKKGRFVEDSEFDLYAKSEEARPKDK